MTAENSPARQDFPADSVPNTTPQFLKAKVSAGKTLITVKLGEKELHAALGILPGFKLTGAIVQPSADPDSEEFEIVTTWVIHDHQPNLMYRGLDALAEDVTLRGGNNG